MRRSSEKIFVELKVVL